MARTRDQGSPAAIRATRRLTWRGGLLRPTPDELAVEEPLEIRLDGETFAVTMRTPGDDLALVLGLLFAEGLVEGVEDVGSVSHCGRPGTAHNVVDVVSAPGRPIDPERVLASRRWLTTTSACGVCGAQSIETLLSRLEPLNDRSFVDPRLVLESLATLSRHQPVFRRTGGLHAAAAFDAAGRVLAAREDVGRHNAVDKVVGALLRSGSRESARLLVVSGRAGFEIVQKAAVAGIGCVASVSAPSSLAVELAEACGVTLAGFVRGESFNVYAHPERLVTPVAAPVGGSHPPSRGG